MNSPEDDDIFPEGYRAAQREQASRLKDDAAKAGLNFEAHLASEDAVWALEAIEKGQFMTPAELVWVAVQQFIEMQAYPDLRRELLKRELQKAMDDPRPGIPAEEVFARLKAKAKERERQKPAQWEKVGREFLPIDPGVAAE